MIGDVYETLAQNAKKQRHTASQIALATPSGIVYVDDPNKQPLAKRAKNRSLLYRIFFGCLSMLVGWGYNEKKEIWQIQINLSTNPVRALYYSFHYNARYFKILILFYKLLLVAITISLFNEPVIVLSLVSVLHVLLLGLLALSRPYTFSLETFLHVAATVLCIFDTIYVLMLVLFQVPSFVFYIVLGINVILFFVVILVLFLSFASRTKFTWKYQQLFRKTRKFQKHITKIEMEDNLADNHANINYKLTRTNLNILVNFLMVMGLTLVVALFLCILSMTRHEFLTDHFPSLQRAYLATIDSTQRCSDTQRLQFAGYDSWSAFTDNCCCTHADYFVDSVHASRYPLVELWYCLNGEGKERIRHEQRDSTMLSGENIRSFCAREFASGYSADECGILRYNSSVVGAVPRSDTYEEEYLW